MLEKLGVQRVTIKLPFRLNHVNCFIAESETGHLIIDTGLHRDKTKSIWQDVIQNKEVTDIIVTHLHPDHSGYAGQLQKETGAVVSMPKRDRKIMDEIWTDSAIPTLLRDYNRAAIPKAVIDGIMNVIHGFRAYTQPFPTVKTYLKEGDYVQIGKYEYKVIETPGHSPSLIVFYNEEKNVLFSTDHILPKITPNISYWFYGEKNPLQSYEQSLQKIKQLNAHYVIPSHGSPFYGANERIDEIWNHHVERLGVTLDAVAHGTTIYDVNNVLFPQQLTFHEQQFAIGETISHLEYLRAKGECVRELQDEQWVYKRS